MSLTRGVLAQSSHSCSCASRMRRVWRGESCIHLHALPLSYSRLSWNRCNIARNSPYYTRNYTRSPQYNAILGFWPRTRHMSWHSEQS